MKPRFRSALATAAFLGLLAMPAGARAAVPNPAANQTAARPSVCGSSPTGAACENRWIVNLDKGRAAMGLGPYKLPSDFTSLAPASQALILANLDRIAYGVPAIVGVDPSLMSSLDKAVSSDADPLVPSGYPGDGAFGSNWGEGFANIVEGYWAWLYDDGYGGGNLDCTTPSDAGCWIHRQVAFVAADDGDATVVGVGTGKDSANHSSYAMLVVGRSASSPPPAYTYTWAQALADGAGTYAYDPGPANNPRLTIKTSGPGSVYGSFSCARSACHTYRSAGTRISLRARSKPHARFLGWGGACSGNGACRLTLDSDAQVAARFTCRAPWGGPSCRSRRG